MGVTKKNTYVIGSNNDLTNGLENIDINRIGADLTELEDDGGTLKVSVGCLIESQGSIYVVDTTAETPTGGPPAAGDFLYFDDTVPGFLWSAVEGTFDPTRGGIYNGSNQRQCRIRMTSATEYGRILPTWQGANLDKNGNEVVAMIAEYQEFDDSFTASTPPASTTRSHTFTFANDVQGVASAYGYMETNGSFDANIFFPVNINISGDQVTVSWENFGLSNGESITTKVMITAFID